MILLPLGCQQKRAPEPSAAAVPPTGEPTTPTPSPGPPATSGLAALPGNAVQKEMRLLTSILEATVRDIGRGDVREIEHQLHQLHAAKEATEAAIEAGRYRPPKGADRLERFHALDEAFHKSLAALVVASRNNDIDATAKALGAVVLGCHGCHTEFRDR